MRPVASPLGAMTSSSATTCLFAGAGAMRMPTDIPSRCDWSDVRYKPVALPSEPVVSPVVAVHRSARPVISSLIPIPRRYATGRLAGVRGDLAVGADSVPVGGDKLGGGRNDMGGCNQ